MLTWIKNQKCRLPADFATANAGVLIEIDPTSFAGVQLC
jgi:hypothetical protein